MASIKSLKNPDNYFCEGCNYETYSKKDFNKHILTAKHNKLENASKMLADSVNLSSYHNQQFICNCGKSYAHDSSYYRHKKKCTYKDDNIVKEKEEEPTDKELILKILKQNSELIKENSELRKEQTDIKELILEIVKNGTINNSHNNTTHTNSHNKAFNLNFFLNETCKNAMNITDFVDSIKIQLSDLMEIGEIGYVEGISKIIVKNLNNLDETIRPVHCTDKKRETMYIKDEGEWNKEDEKKTKLKKAVTKVADKNIKLLPQFREKYPEYKNSSSKTSDKYDKMVLEVMTCDDDKNEKIVKNISKVTIIKD